MAAYESPLGDPSKWTRVVSSGEPLNDVNSTSGGCQRSAQNWLHILCARAEISNMACRGLPRCIRSRLELERRGSCSRASGEKTSPLRFEGQHMEYRMHDTY